MSRRREFRPIIETEIGPDLAAIGAEFAEERRLDMGGGYHKDLCFYRLGTGWIEIETSYHDGLNCRVSKPGETDLSKFEDWPSLWELTGMTALFPSDEEIERNPGAIDAYLDLYPEAYDDLLRFIGAKLGELAGQLESGDAVQP